MPVENFIFRVSAFLKYQLRAVGVHSLHSPFLYDLFNQVIKPSRSFRNTQIEKERKLLRKNVNFLEVTDFKTNRFDLKTIGSITSSSLSKPRFSAFLYLLSKHLETTCGLETGTSLGITSCYLSKACLSLVTIEGSNALSAIAKKNFEKFDCTNVRLVNGDLYQVLEPNIVKSQPDFYFLDADHRSNAIAFCIDLILKHTPNTKCIVVHDIYWSGDMANFWESLIGDPRFTLTVDLFQAGLLFPTLEMEKQHFTIRF